MSKRSAADAVDAEDNASTSKRFRAAVDESASHLICAITQELPLEPVTAEDGNIYERSAIEEWLGRQQKSPLTNKPMGTKLLPAHQVKSMIETMVKSGAISGDKADSWRKRLEGEKTAAALKAKAEAGDAEAMIHVAKNCNKGTNGFRKDPAQAFHWAERAAQAGHFLALHALGLCYQHGIGIAKDLLLGLALLTEAATLGRSSSCFQLGYAYAHGKHGASMSAAHARRWYERGCRIIEQVPEEQRSELEKRHLKPAERWLQAHAQEAPDWVAAKPSPAVAEAPGYLWS